METFYFGLLGLIMTSDLPCAASAKGCGSEIPTPPSALLLLSKCREKS
jgi:hypothetical protein